MSVEIVLVYQSLLGIYGDRGNAMVLRQRLIWRGIYAVLTEVEPGDPVPATGAVYLLGGGEDAAQVSAVRGLQADGNLFRAIDNGAVLFAVCAGYQIAGTTFTVGEQDTVIEGLGLLDATTRRGTDRAVGEILTSWTHPDGSESLITGFEFDSSFARGVPAKFQVNQVLKGWQEILPMMKVGDHWQLFLPPEQAYGMRGQGPIGPNEALVFEIKLIDVK